MHCIYNNKQFISNKNWKKIFDDLYYNDYRCNYVEKIGMQYTFNPVTDHIMSNNSSLFNIKKAAAMYFWYKKGHLSDYSILKYFDEYRKCIDINHKLFNSNYGYYAYRKKGLEKCIKELIKNKYSRQACFCINNNKAMDENSIDKLCTNVIHFFIRHNTLIMVVQMRSSNFITLLPYDAFMFSVFYMQVYRKLKGIYKDLCTGHIKMQVASLHLYGDNLKSITVSQNNKIPEQIINFESKNCETELEKYLLNKLKEK